MVELIKQIQKFLNIEVDGVAGPQTFKAIAEKLGVKQPVISDNVSKLINFALKDLGIVETSPNHGEGIEKYWSATDYSEGYKDRAPYCAAAVSYWVKNSGILPAQKCPSTASAFGMEQQAREKGLTLHKPPTSVRKGQIVVFSFSHVGISISDSDSKGNFLTIEANTSSGNAGSQRDGGGVFKRTRNLSLVRSTIDLV